MEEGAGPGSASTSTMAPNGWLSVTVILPDLSSAVMPEMSLALPESKSSAPAMKPVRNDLAAQLILRARLIPNLKSLALIGRPSE